MQVIPTADMLTLAQQAVEAWAPLAGQPHLNPLRGALISADLGGIPSLILAHDYHPAAVSLEAAHLLPTTSASGLVSSWLLSFNDALGRVQGWTGLVNLPELPHELIRQRRIVPALARANPWQSNTKY